jgi:hypothetical protein
MEVSGQLHAPAALHPGKEPLVPIGQKAGRYLVQPIFLVMVFWIVMPCSDVARYQCSKGPRCLDLMLKMEAAMSSEMMAFHHITTWHQKPQHKLYHHFGNLI